MCFALSYRFCRTPYSTASPTLLLAYSSITHSIGNHQTVNSHMEEGFFVNHPIAFISFLLPLEKQRQMKSQPSLKIFNNNNNSNKVQTGVISKNLNNEGSCLYCLPLVRGRLWGEWPSGPASSLSFTEVKHGSVRSETGWATFHMNDQNSSPRRPSEGTLN